MAVASPAHQVEPRTGVLAALPGQLAWVKSYVVAGYVSGLVRNDVGHAVSGNGNGAHDEKVDSLPRTRYDGNGHHDEAQEPPSSIS